MSSLHCTDHATYNETCLRCMKTQAKLATKFEDLFPFQYPRTEAEYEQFINLAGGRGGWPNWSESIVPELKKKTARTELTRNGV